MNLPAPKDLFWIGNTGDWNDSGHWSTTSGGSSSGCVPTPYDNAIFDGNSFTGGGQAVEIDKVPYCKDMDWSSVGNAPTPPLTKSPKILKSGIRFQKPERMYYRVKVLGKEPNLLTKDYC